jgi:hypothetical protein
LTRPVSFFSELELARAERDRRLYDMTDRRARNAFRVSLAAVGLPALALVMSFLMWRFPLR